MAKKNSLELESLTNHRVQSLQIVQAGRMKKETEKCQGVCFPSYDGSRLTNRCTMQTAYTGYKGDLVAQTVSYKLVDPVVVSTNSTTQH